MIAALPMYDRPETRAALDAFWSSVRDALGHGPEHLDRELAYDAGWGRADLLLGQICNLPYRAQYRDNLVRLACVDHRLPSTPAGYYHSVFVVRAQDAARGLAPAALGCFAYSDALSQSGWGAAVKALSDRGLAFRATLRTGSHLESARAVAEGRADLAAIDALTWRMLSRWEPCAQDLAVVDRTGISPAMTFVTAKGNDPAPLLSALSTAMGTLAPEHADTLSFHGLVTLPDRAYDLPLPPLPQRPVAIDADLRPTPPVTHPEAL